MRFLRFLPPILFGGVLGSVLAWIITGDWIYAIVFGVTLGPAIISATFLSMRGRLRVGPGDHGYAAGRVESVQRVGANAAGQQQADVRVSVFTQNDSPYQTTMRTVVDDAALRKMAIGSFIPLLRLGQITRPDVSYAPDAPPEWMAKVEELRAEASTLPVVANVKPWETATTTTPGTPKPGQPRKRTTRYLGLIIVLVVAAAVMIPSYVSIARGVNNILQGRLDGSNMVTGLYQQQSIDQMAAAAGTTQFTSLSFFPDFILGDALSKSEEGEQRTDSVEWRFGRAWVDGPSSSQSSDLSRELFDVSELDFSKVAEVARDGLARSGIENPESVYAFVRADSETGVPEITISIDGPYDDAYMNYTFGGELISASGTAFE